MAILALLALVALVPSLALRQRPASAAPYADPFYTNGSGSQETAMEEVASLSMTPEGVDLRTGELFVDHLMLTMPGLFDDNVMGMRWRSMLSGSTQMGRGWVPSWELTVKKTILNAGSPNSANGHIVDVRRFGRIDTHTWNGTSYTAPGDVYDALTTNGSGNYVLTDKWGNAWGFDSLGMPATYTDRNANVDTYTYNSSYQITGYTDERAKSYTFTRNSNGYLTSVTDGASRVWTLGYDSADNLTTVVTPATADQTSGVTTTYNYDGSNRLTSKVDGRGNTAFSVSYVGSTGQVSSITINGNTISYTYASGRTDRTDRLGNVSRCYYTGTQTTKRDMYVSSASKYATLYRYSGVNLSNVVYPVGNRVDFTFDSVGNLTERRHRTADTATNASTDLVHTWAYTSNFATSYTDPRGNAWTFSRDGSGNLTGVTHPTVTSPATQTASTSISYNGAGQRTSETNEEGKVTSYTYGTSGASIGLLTSSTVDSGTGGLGLATSYGYDSAGNLATVTDPRSKVFSFSWDNVRRLTQSVAPSPLSYTINYHYDANGNVTSQEVENRDKDGTLDSSNPWIVTSYTYSNTNDLSTIVEEVTASTTRTTSFDYDANQNRIRVVKPEGNKVRTYYDERDLLWKVTTGETATGASTVECLYDDNGNRVTVIDGRSNSTTYEFDLFDRLRKTTNALGHYDELSLDKNGNVTQIDRKNSGGSLILARSTRSFDQRNRLWRVADRFKDPVTTHADAVTTIERYKTGQVKKVTDALLNDTTTTIDGAGRITKVTDASGNEVETTYDGSGNVTAWTLKEVDGASPVTHAFEATVDALGRRTEKVEVDRTNSSNRLSTTYGYDSRGNRTFMVNAEGNPTRWTYDALSRMVQVERALTVGTPIENFTSAQVTQYAFDKNDRLTSHTDDGTNASAWIYDALDRPTSMTYPDSTSASYQYDLNGNVTQVTDPIGSVIADTFDALNQNTSRVVTRATGVLDTTTEARTFDAIGRLLTNEDDDYKVEYEWAAIGLRSFPYTEKQSYVTGSAYLKTVTKTIDAMGRVTGEAYPSGCNLSLVRAYDAIGQLTSVTDGVNSIASFLHVGFRPKQITYGNTSKTEFSYTGFRDEVETIHHKTAGGTTMLRLDYGYNNLHDRIYERYGSSGAAGDAFAYDKLRRLTTAWMGSVGVTTPMASAYVKKIDYSMDDDGNRTSVNVTPYGVSSTSTSYTTNNLNQYSAVGGTSRTHDANGNLTNDGTYKFEYNYKNLICKVRNASTNAVIADYRYDASGRRVEKSVTGGIFQRFIYSGVETIATFAASDTWKQNYVFGQGIDQVLMLEQADVLDYDADSNTAELTRSYYQTNGLGSVMAITDANQSDVATYRYTPYGEVTITRSGSAMSSDPLGQGWTYTGRFSDEETGLMYYRARYYRTTSGVFLQRDGLSYDSGPNLYQYAAGDPATLTDPTGMYSFHPSGNPYAAGSDAHKKVEEANAADKKKLAEAAAKAKPVMEWLLKNVPEMFTRLAKNWDREIAIGCLPGFFEEGGSGGPSVMIGNPGSATARYDPGRDTVNYFEKLEGWELVLNMLHEFIHYAASKMDPKKVDVERTTPNGDVEKDPKAKDSEEIGTAFEKELKGYVGGRDDIPKEGGSSSSDAARDLHGFIPKK